MAEKSSRPPRLLGMARPLSASERCVVHPCPFCGAPALTDGQIGVWECATGYDEVARASTRNAWST